ncbi:hypothetical protein GH714_031821 [Hevea brasiliensis]|uniref:Uncharacterized protein n=1 Tax=Hevea brasiliensis TaxID=3981 RepID=A0A6A6LFY7_HEVBR|nr:hypothetical protein GH714_031821 [Hevea brasiliensis]
MGTKMQPKMYLSGYYPMRDLNDGTGNFTWPSHHENKAFGQYYDIFTARPAIDGYLGYDKEQLRQTILKHETIFRKQLHELHRLYKIQMEMMNEVRSEQPQKHLKPMGTSQSSFFAFPSLDDKNRWQDSSLPLVDFSHHIPSASGADSIQSHFSSMNVNILQSCCGSTQNGSRSKEYESLEFKRKNLQRRLFDLELPADEYMNDEEEEQGASGGSGVESCPANRNCDIACEKNGNLSTHSGAYSICNGDASSSNMNLKRNLGFTDLNEPVQIAEASGTASVDILGNFISFREGIQRIDLSASSCSGFLAKETSQSPPKEKYEGVNARDQHLEDEKRQKGGSPFTFNPGQTTSKKSPQNEGFKCDYLPAICESSQVGCQKAQEPDQNRREKPTRKTIFGAEISETNHDASVVASDTLQPLIPQSSVANSESSSISSWKKHPASWTQNLTSVPGNSCHSAFPKSDNGSTTLMHGHEVTGNGSLVNNNVKLVPSLKAEPSYQNSSCLFSQLDSKESQVCHGSVGFGYLNGFGDSNSASEQIPQHGPTHNLGGSGWMGNSKSSEVANAVLPKSCQNEAIFSDSKLIFVDGTKKEENPKGGFSWLRDISFCNGKNSKERNGSHQVNSQHFAIKAETMKNPSQSLILDSSLMTDSNVHVAEDRRTEVGDCPSSGKIVGIPIFEKQMSKDLPSVSSFSERGCALEIKGAHSIKAGSLLADLNHDPMPSESGETQNSKSLVAEEGSVDCSDNLRNHIDLNVSVTEEEAQPTPFSPQTKVKVALEIDLEAPIFLDSEIDITSGGEFVESKLKEPFDSINDESRDFNEGFLKDAAEVLIAISSSCAHDIQDDTSHHQVEASVSESLKWFAEIITSYKVEVENNLSVSAGTDSTDRGDSLPNGVDYFEYMTLNLTEAKLEEYHCEPQIIENSKDEVTLLRRPRRGQARRGRQRKDFQRDVLPGLASLSRNDVAEDLQTIEGLIKATGGIWQSSFSQRNSPRGKGGRGRKRLGANATSPAVTAVCPPQTLQPKCGELVLEETRLTGWGKRTRRPPRQRCPINHPPFPLQ